MNLMLNGIESMQATGGELTISTQREDGQVLVSVSDTGVDYPPTSWTRSSTLSSRPKLVVLEWDFRSVARSSSRTESICGCLTITDKVPPSISRFRLKHVTSTRLRLDNVRVG
ncbi:MAG TPA: hypothetical protein VF074_11240 [Pyrinomonadaceae bacterium]